MRFRFFTIAAQAPESGQDALDAFCAQHRIVALDKQFVGQGTESFWSVCVTFVPGGESALAAAGKRDRIDYKEVLSEQDFAVFAELRNLRKAMSEQEGVPAYALFTNEQLAEMVTKRVATLAAMGEIEGVGKSRLEKYGGPFIGLLKASLAARPAQGDEAKPHQPG